MYEVGSTLTFVYQAPNVASAVVIFMEVYDETHTLDEGQSNTIGLTEIGATGRYYDTFVPDAEGTWVVVAYKKGPGPLETGHVVQAFEIGPYGMKSIGDTIVAVKEATDKLPADPASQSEVEASITAAKDALKTELDELESPAMVG